MTHIKRKRLTAGLNHLSSLLLVLIVLNISGCAALDRMAAFTGFSTEVSQPDTPEILAGKGLDEFNRGRYHRALKIFEDIKNRFPFSKPALLAKLKAADANYHLKNYEEALALYEEFESSHPTNEAIPYVLFQMGMCNYQQIDTFDRDPGGAINAIHGFSRLILTFPRSPYVEEARARIKAAENFLASHEMYVAMFYVRTEEHDQAEGRLEYLLANYPHTDVAPEAEELLAAIKAGNPPKRSWRSWIPDISLPDWKSISPSFSPSPLPGGGAGEND